MTESPSVLGGMHDVEMLLRREIGLDSSTVGSSLVERAVRRRMEKRAVMSIATYASGLAEDAGELQQLVEEVVVPETYFFREPEALTEVVRRAVAMRPPPRAETPLRILSVPCSSGEEPFSIAIALLMAGLLPGAIAIDAIDISLEGIKHARFGAFRDGSFRGDVGAWKEYFRESARGWELDGKVRDLVRVVHGNLVSPSFQTPRDQYDVIFCRNLLIYFDSETQARALANLTPLLSADGVLVVGSADSFAVRRAGYEPVPGYERSFLFRVLRSEGPIESAYDTGRRSPQRVRREATRVARRAATPSTFTAPISTRQAPPAARVRDNALPNSPLTVIARLANEGRLAEALAIGEEALRDGHASGELLALMGTTLAAIPDLAGAEACYKRALFLEPNNEDALLHLSYLLERRGESALASRLRARAQRIHAPGMPVST